MLEEVIVPADVPIQARAEFIRNYQALGHHTNRFFIFAADHKMEHLDADFYGSKLPPEVHPTHHIFQIASQSPIGGLATQLGLIARFGLHYPNINYVVKLNSKTNLIPSAARDPLSRQLWTVEDVVTFKNQTNLPIRAIGLTVYIGSEYEDVMLNQATQAIFKAHQHGLLAMLWMYPRSHLIENPRDVALLAGAAGVASCLGADIVKLELGQGPAEQFKRVVEAAETTRVLKAGGATTNPEAVLKELHEQMTAAGLAGIAIGRNLYQLPLDNALLFAKALSEMIYKRCSLHEALKIAQLNA